MFDMRLDWLILAQAEKAVDAVQTKPQEGGFGWVMVLVVLAIFIAPFLLGTLIAQALKLKDLSGKIGVVLFTAVMGLTPFLWQIAHGNSWKDAIRLGIDLNGGTNLVFEVDREAAALAGKEISSALMDQMVSAISRRLDPANQEQITVRRVGSDRIEVIIPGADTETIKLAKGKIQRLGSLEFAILANRQDHQPIINEALKLGNKELDVRQGGRIVASWRRVGIDRDTKLSKDVSEDGDVVTRDEFEDGKPKLDADGNQLREFLVMVDPEDLRVTGKFLTRAYKTNDENGALAVGFTFNIQGGHRFVKLTSKNRPNLDKSFLRRLAILLDGEIHSAPNINDVISDRGIISGRFSSQEIDELVNVLNAGALEVPIKPNPISEFSISPLLGRDVQEKGKLAIMISAGVVVVFMLIYYLFAGLVANLCLTLNLVLVMGFMAVITATFTLPGLAGIVLTIGMAVDANVLIFERIREELQRGSSMRMAIQNGFARAFTAIVDANVTTLIIAVVLYAIGTDQVRGFAVTLFIGIVMSMYTSLYVGRLVFDICERKQWLQRLKMLNTVGKTNWNFLSKKSIAATVSLALILVGMGALVSRGEDNLDIDFTGGTMVTFQFVEPQQIDEVRGILQEKLGTSITLEQLTLSVEQPTISAVGSDKGKRFRLRTKKKDLDTVRGDINEALTDTGHELRKVTIQFGEFEKISSAAGEEAAGKDTEFPGGLQVALTFSEEISVPTIQDSLAEEIEKFLDENGEQKYDEPASLLKLVGTEGDVDSATGQVGQFTKMLLTTTANLAPDDLKTSLATLQKTMAANPTFDEVNSFNSSIASEMRTSALVAMLASLAAIVAYIGYRFQRVMFGLAAVVALVHDVLIVIGMVALASYVSHSAIGQMLDLYDFKINLPMIAAFLTIVGYSLNDTIVVFDRIREVRGKDPALTVEMVNTSLNQTLSRTILTSLTTFFVVAILYSIGGEGIHGFAFCLVLGVIVGTYSSIYVASPALLWLMNRPGSELSTASLQRRKAAAAR